MNILDTPLDIETYGHEYGGTVRGFFKACVLKLWHEEDGFSGKRPFGDSSWAFDITYAVAEHLGYKSKDGQDLREYFPEEADDYFEYRGLSETDREEVERKITEELERWLSGS